jgi:thymidylate synthase (FAD)
VKALIKVQHLGVLEHVNFTFHVSEISRALTHQLVRHRIGFSYLQMSNRHTKPNEFDYVIPDTCITPSDWTEEDGKVDTHEIFEWTMDKAWAGYQDLLAHGVPIEDARYVLPPAFFTHISFTCNARSLRHFLELRLEKGAQWEIREMACKIFDIVYGIYPLLFEDLLGLRLQNSELTVEFDVTKSHKEGDITVVDEVDLKSISI